MKYKNIRIQKRKDTITGWFARFQKNGVGYRVSAKTQVECYEKLKKLYNQILKSKDLKKPSFTTFGEWKERWLSLYKVNRVRETTIKVYQYLDKYIPENLLNKNIAKITSIELMELINSIEATRSAQKFYEYLRDIFNKAFKNKLISEDLFLNIQKPLHDKKESKAMTLDQENKFVRACADNRMGDLFLVALYQGLRRGEVMALKPNDIDINNMTLRIDESENEKTLDTRTKNKNSNRVMPLFEKTKKILEKYINNEPEERIFNLSAKPIQLEFKKILKNAGLPDFKIHELRHTFITRAKEKNIPEHIVQYWVGHSIGSKVTSSVYTHINWDSMSKEVEKLNKI